MKKQDLSKYTFTDAEFQTASEKAKVLRDWERFLRLGMEFKNFSKLLYRHLISHCSFIAHYDRYGFYDTYFTRPSTKTRFLGQFESGISMNFGQDWWLNDGRDADINRAMCDVARARVSEITCDLGVLPKEDCPICSPRQLSFL